jgi:hypothetical protein
VLGVVCTATAFIVFFALISDIGPARATVITYVNPAVAVLLGVLLLGEHVTLGMGIGFPLILVGSVLAARKAAVPEVAVAEPVAAALFDPDVASSDSVAQSSRTAPKAVSNTAATNPVSSSAGTDHSTSIPSNG